MAEWFHCNKCYLEITSGQGAKYLLTNCGHIFCDNCLKSGKQNFCFICGNECTMIELSSNISPDIQIYFTDLSASLQKFMKVQDFQRNHCKKLLDHKTKQIKLLEEKYIHAKDYIKKLSTQFESIQRDNKRLRNLLQMSIGSPTPGNNSRRNLNDSGSVVNISQTPTPISGRNPNRSIARGQPCSNVIKNMMDKRDNSQQNFRTPKNYPQTPSLASVASSTGSRISLVQGRTSGVPSVYRPSPGSLNLSGLTFGR